MTDGDDAYDEEEKTTTTITKTTTTRRYGGFSLEHPQGVGIVGIVGTVGTVGIVGIEFCRSEPQPTTSSVLVDISSYSYLKEQTLRYT